MTIEDLYDKLFITSALFFKKTGEHPPTVLAVLDDGQIGYIAEVTDKEEAFRRQQQLAAIPECFAAVFISEAWQVKLPGDLAPDELDAVVELGAANHPERDEVLVFSFMTATRQAIGACPITRPGNTVERTPLAWVDTEHPLTQGNMMRSAPPLH